MITDLFSHKIHSTGEEWPEKLAELAAIFGEFDGSLYDRAAFESRLQRISPRASYFAKEAKAKTAKSRGARLDVSKFRDEISAYPAYLGLYFLEQSSSGWVVRVSETAKHFLLREEPDVAAFLRLQLPLFQYPNAMGAAYRSRTNKLNIQANVRDRTLEFIKQGIHLSPIRLIAIALKADAALQGRSILDAQISFKEIISLANAPTVSQRALPSLGKVMTSLEQIRAGKFPVPQKYERRFHTLIHTEMFEVDGGFVRLRSAVDRDDSTLLERQLEAICSINLEFKKFDSCKNAEAVEEVIASGEWGRYFDGIRVLPGNIVEALASDRILQERSAASATIPAVARPIPPPAAEIYDLRDRARSLPDVKPYDRRRELADPELTRIKRQRRNLMHKELIDKMDEWLRKIGAQPKENDHIDLFAKIPSNGSFIFEMKSGGDSLLEQIRKGLSQLYEYRYRYKKTINDPHISLCLVLPELPTSIPWLVDYLCKDREIQICWFNENGKLEYPESCAKTMELLRPVHTS